MKKSCNIPISTAYLTLLILTAVFYPAGAPAKEQPVGKKLETLTVTAQKRKENIQDVPMSITALSETQIEDAGITDLEGLAFYTPNLHLPQSGQRAEQTPVIRGMYNRMNPNPTVGLFVDGVAYGRHLAYNPDLLDIERIEVLKGPQGTLFGRNTEAGAISITTKKPGPYWEGKAQAGYGDYNSQDYSVLLKGPVDKTLFFAVGGKKGLSDGYVENDYLGTDDAEYTDDLSGYASLRWMPAHEWDILFNANGVRYESRSDGFGPIEEMRRRPNHVALDHPGTLENRANGQTLNIDYRGRNIRVTAITAHRNADLKTNYDMDFTTVDLMRNDYTQHQDQWTQEIRFTSAENPDSPFKWLFGAFYLDEDFDVDVVYDFRQGFPAHGIPPYETTQNSWLATRNYAFFGQASYTFREKIQLTAGMRYDKDEKEFSGTAYNTPDVMGSGTTRVERKKSSAVWLPKVALGYYFTKDVMAYANVAKGYTAGAFNELDASVLGTPYDAEYSWNYEAGIKSGWMRNRVILNLSAFYIDWKDKQVFIHTGAVSNIFKNAAEATSKGFEIEALVRPVSGLEVIGGFGYTHATYDAFTEPEFDPASGTKIGEKNYSGKTLEFAPEYNYNLALQYRYPVSDSQTLMIRLENQGIGDQYFDLSNRKGQKAFQKFNAKLGIEGKFQGYDYSFYLWARNIFDEGYLVSAWGSDQRGWLARSGEPRRIGATFQVRF